MLNSYSHSSLSSFRTCPRQFAFNKIEKIKIPSRPTADAFLGSAVHRVLEELYRLGADGIVLEKKAVLEMYDKEWSGPQLSEIVIVADHYTVDDYIRMGREMLERHYDAYQPFKPGDLIGVEFSTSFTLPDTNFKLTARIDRLLRLPDGTVEIADYKTGRTVLSANDAPFRNQMGIYHLAIKERFPDFENIEVAQYYLRRNEVVKYKFRPDELDLLSAELRSQIIDTIRAEKLNDFPAKESQLCNYCDFQTVCPARRHKLILEQVGAEELEDIDPAIRARDLAAEYILANQNQKLYKAQVDTLKQEIIQLAKDTGWAKFSSSEGDLKITVSEKEKFVTKTDDAEAFADLSRIVREMGMEDYFKLEGPAFLKDIYQKELLTKEQLEQLSEFVLRVDNSRVTPLKKKKTDSD